MRRMCLLRLYLQISGCTYLARTLTCEGLRHLRPPIFPSRRYCPAPNYYRQPPLFPFASSTAPSLSVSSLHHFHPPWRLGLTVSIPCLSPLFFQSFPFFPSVPSTASPLLASSLHRTHPCAQTNRPSPSPSPTPFRLFSSLLLPALSSSSLSCSSLFI